METPQDKYENDLSYKQFVDTVEAMLHQCQLTPYEVRAGSLLACIHYEMRSFTRVRAVPVNVEDALNVIRKYRTDVDKSAECTCGIAIGHEHQPGCRALK